MLQHINIHSISDKNIMVIKSDFRIDGMYLFLKEFYTLLLGKIFFKMPIEIITLNPDKDALCYDLGNYKMLEIKKDKFVVNKIENPTLDTLMQVACTTEFELGTLAIFKQDSLSLEERVQIAYKYFNSDIEESNEAIINMFCYCEPDGYILYLVNTPITEIEIMEVASKAADTI